jgi:hypothetical protein
MLLLTVTFFVSCKSEENPSDLIESNNEFLNKDLQKNSLNGKVKSVKQYSVDQNEKRGTFFWYKEFNKKGILIKSEENVDSSKLVIRCDSNGIPISGIQYFNSSFNDIKERVYKYKYEYNGQGLLKKESYKSEQSKSIDYNLYYKYNENGFETSERTFSKGVLITLDSTVYDKKNRIIKELHLRPDTIQPYYQTVTIYSGNIKKETTTDHKMPCSSYGPEYTIKELDSYGNPITVISVRGDDTLYNLKCEYEFDKYNNWIKCISYDKDSISSTGRRDITYH